MNLKSLVAFLSAAQLATGCILVADGGGNRPPPAVAGDVTFSWSFAGRSCAEMPNVKSVIVEIPGERLQNDGVFPCSANNYPGIVLHDFAPGSYDYSLTAVGYGNETLFTGGGSFSVNGATRVTLDLTPVGGGTSYAYLTWRFPPNSAASNPTCQQAGVAFVDISIDGNQNARFNCVDGFNQPGVQTPYLSPGTHTIELVALSDNNYPYYRFSGQLQTFSGNPISAEYRLAWAVGGVALRWKLTNAGLTCGEAGLQTMKINFQDESGKFVYGSAGDLQACDAAPVVYNFLLPGTYRVSITGTGPGGTYTSNPSSPPVVTVRAGEFVGPDAATTVLMY